MAGVWRSCNSSVHKSIKCQSAAHPGIDMETLVLFPCPSSRGGTTGRHVTDHTHRFTPYNKGWSLINYACCTDTHDQIKVRSSGQAVKLETIKQSRLLSMLLRSRSRRLFPPIPRPLLVGDQGSRLS